MTLLDFASVANDETAFFIYDKWGICVSCGPCCRDDILSETRYAGAEISEYRAIKKNVIKVYLDTSYVKLYNE